MMLETFEGQGQGQEQKQGMNESTTTRTRTGTTGGDELGVIRDLYIHVSEMTERTPSPFLTKIPNPPDLILVLLGVSRL
jgi:hypothetical protein